MEISIAGLSEVGPDYPDRVDIPVMVLGLDPIPDAWQMPFHAHRKAQLLVATRGLIMLETAAGLWVVPPQGAIWIPGGLSHRASSSGRPHGFVVFVEPGVVPGLPTHCAAMAITPFMQALLEHASNLPQQYASGSAQDRLMGVFLDELIAAPPEWLHLPMPSDARLRRLANAMLDTPLVLRWVHRREIAQPLVAAPAHRPLTEGGRLSALGVLFTGTVLLVTSALNGPLGLATFCAGTLSVAVVAMRQRRSPLPLLRHVSWGVLPLVAGLFVLVEAVAQTGVIQTAASALQAVAQASSHRASWMAGGAAALLSNVANNLPVGLAAGSLGQMADLPAQTRAALLVGVDLGPNLSVTGSLATMLWLVALRREGEHVSALDFLRVGALVMPPALIGALLLL